MGKFNTGDKVRVNSESFWEGAEGTVVESDSGSTRLTLTKAGENGGGPSYVGADVINLSNYKLDLIEPERRKFKEGDRIEFTEDYSRFAKKGDKGTVTRGEYNGSYDGPFIRLQKDNGESVTAYARRVMLVETPEYNIGDVLRVGTGGWAHENFVGQEFKVEEITLNGYFRGPITKRSGKERGYWAVGTLVTRTPDQIDCKVEESKDEEPEAPFKVGDKVRVNSVATNWEGMEGVITVVKYGGTHASLKVTKNSPDKSVWRTIGDTVNLPATKFDVIPEFPREAKLEEIQVGDTVRVTYPPHTADDGGVTETFTRVREGVVREIQGTELVGDTHLINGCFKGRREAQYEILSRPEPEPVKVKNWAELKPVGSKGLQKSGARLIQKTGEDAWLFTYLNEGGSTMTRSDKGTTWLLNENDILWANAN